LKKDRSLFQRFVEWCHSVLKRLVTLNAVDRDIIKLQQKFKRLAETSERTANQSGKGEGQYVLASEGAKTANNSCIPIYVCNMVDSLPFLY